MILGNGLNLWGCLYLVVFFTMFTNVSAGDVPAMAVPAATEHNIIRNALSNQTVLGNLGFYLNESYDFSLQAKPATPLAVLKDDPLLQDSAAQHAQHCEFKHQPDSPYGQNLFAGTGTRWAIGHAVNSWANEAPAL